MIMQQVEIRGGHGGERSAQFLQLGDFVFVGHRVAVAIHPQVGSFGIDFLGFSKSRRIVVRASLSSCSTGLIAG